MNIFYFKHRRCMLSADNPPKRNAMDNVLADIEVDDPTAHVDSDQDMADVAPRAVQKQEKQKKDKKEKKEKRVKNEDGANEKKKRKHSETNGEVEGKKQKKIKK